MKHFLLSVPASVVFLGACTAAPEQPTAGAALPACGSFPNCVSSQAGDDAQAVAPITATRSQWRALIERVAEQPDWELVQIQNDFLQATVRTPLMEYTDDVQMQYDPESQLIQVRSSSRLGYGDMGANRDRVEELRALVATLR